MPDASIAIGICLDRQQCRVFGKAHLTGQTNARAMR